MAKKANYDKGKEFEKKVFSFLKEMGITPKGYYEYPAFADLIGYQKSQPPYKFPAKVMAEVSAGKLTIDKILSFSKTTKDNQVTKSLIFGTDDYDQLADNVKEAMQKAGIEYFGPKELSKFLRGKSVSLEQVQQYKKASEVVAPPSLVDSLPELALQKIPMTIQSALKAANPGVEIPAWEIFEEAVYSAFLSCFGYNVRKLGKDALFEEEPEGVVTLRDHKRTAFLYECKSAQAKYHMTADDKTKYIEYIDKKKLEVRAKDKAELRYFVLVGPDFRGDKENRRDEIHHKTGVLLIYLKASMLKMLAQWACGITDHDLKQLIDIGEIFSKLQQLEVGEETIKKYIDKFDKKYRT